MAQRKIHLYRVTTIWEGAQAGTTRNYTAYSREHRIETEGKAALPMSADPAFRGDAGRTNPEELLVASLSSCHMLWYLHLCAESGVEVMHYQDAAEGKMVEAEGAGRFASVTLRPRVTISAASDPVTARALHERAHKECFIANSVNFPVLHESEIVLAESAQAESKAGC